MPMLAADHGSHNRVGYAVGETGKGGQLTAKYIVEIRQIVRREDQRVGRGKDTVRHHLRRAVLQLMKPARAQNS